MVISIHPNYGSRESRAFRSMVSAVVGQRSATVRVWRQPYQLCRFLSRHSQSNQLDGA